jgi:hypothetical protein
MGNDEIFRQFPCMGCDHWRSLQVKARVTAIFLDLERGGRPKIPSREALTERCCQRIIEQGGVEKDSVTIIALGQAGKL